MKRLYFFFFLSLYVIAVFYLSITTPISPHEAKLFYTSSEPHAIFMHWGHLLLRDAFLGDFLGLRLFFILFGFLSIGLFYKVSRTYFSYKYDAYMATTLFMFLPGILTASTLVNVSIIVLPMVLFFILFYERKNFWLLAGTMLGLFWCMKHLYSSLWH
ncbi:MAG: glycosyltransferase family 39 protein [Sulfurovum sp.]|nr:glycosyltransferase family 39 protein [Sulfurovum sp.]